MRSIFGLFVSVMLFWSNRTGSAESLPSIAPSASTEAKSVPQYSPPAKLAGQYCAPFYPRISVRLNQQGDVVIDVEISPQGTVTDVRVVKSSGFEALDDAAIACAKQWTYRPATQNRIPIASQTQARVKFALSPGGGPILNGGILNWVGSPLWPPPSAPQGWLRDASSEGQAGVIAAYRFSASDPASDQFISAGAYSNVANLDDYVARHDAELRGLADSGSLTEKRIAVCGAVQAWEAEYSRSGLIPRAPRQALVIRQVAVVMNGNAYVATYIRPGGAAARPDADEWIHSYCRPNS